MQGRMRQAANQLCRRLSEVFTPVFGFPEPLSFGGAGSEGTSTAFSRSNHVHALADVPEETLEQFDDFAFVVDDFQYSDEGNTPYSIQGTPTDTMGGLDVEGEVGAPNCYRAARSTISVWSLQMRNSINTNFTDQDLIYRRLIRWEGRVRPCASFTELATIRFIFGGIRAGSTTADVLGGGVTDGAGFFLETDGTGAGNWIAFSVNNGSLSTQDTGRAPRVDGSNVIKFDFLRMDFDKDEERISYFIGDLQDSGEIVFTLVAEISDNIPQDTRKLAFWGLVGENLAAKTTEFAIDYWVWKGHRIHES